MTSNPTLLIVIRIVQGLAAALIQPQVLSMMQVNFLPRKKSLVFSIYGALLGFGFAFGLILGGILVNLTCLILVGEPYFFQCSLRYSCSSVFAASTRIVRQADAEYRLDRYRLNDKRTVSASLSTV
ncbi:MFS transporter [Brevibacillus halotolerans]|uniref:MFS transporter n=1 Tax=Brevibacillus TaxID=55080 RepID=UPI00215CAB8C|nr:MULTISPECIES: MFS transporter [Brevibacillus]MCR8966162.1 MFS transporter [Brevibacillus laterosporus]MCZ0838319.1 MFS transporter [Brevibacillus halotolerans]